MSKKPPITISSLDLERLETLIESTPDAVFPGKAALLDEL
ncbi:MAG: nucleoside diphosphate kinase regulator, partial [Burkholderiales bacterium]|nr:nucleoside diphosphate kinase regulator [Burkholderiales bacterium]